MHPAPLLDAPSDASPADAPDASGHVAHAPTPHAATLDAAAALRQLLGAISDAIDAREPLPPRVGRAYNAVLAGHAARPR